MTDDTPRATATCRYCAIDEDMAMFCRHTPAEVALAEAIARAVQGDSEDV